MFVLERIKEYAKTNRVAVVHREESMSFSELDARSDSFAAYLLRRFGDDRTPVVVYGHKENDFLSVIFGLMKSGHAYVPVDISVPPHRVAEIIADIAPEIIVNFSALQLNSDTETNAEIIDADTLKNILKTRSDTEIPKEKWVSADMPVYILFTSGSTGKPKGVVITVNNLTNFYEGLSPCMSGESGGVMLNHPPYSFDLSCCAVYVGLSCGMTLFSVDRKMIEEPGILFKYLRESNLTVWVSTPSFAEFCACSAAFCGADLPLLEQFLFCGEVLTHKLCDDLAKRFPSARILNSYGPTEATVLVTAVRITEEMRRDTRPIPIGYPFSEVELRIADSDNELRIISDSVSPGYYKRPDLSGKVFFDDNATGKRGYRTGDICTCENGLYYYKGRADNQLKLDGYRIETEDIENNLVRIENIARAAVVPVWEDGRVKYLAAFLLLEKEDGLTSMARSVRIKKLAAALLPAYMIPRKLIAVDTFPLNVNGKVDKKALSERILSVKL